MYKRQTLIRDGRIQPGRIEDVVRKVTNELNDTIMKTGEDAVFKLQIGRIDKELVRLQMCIRDRRDGDHPHGVPGFKNYDSLWSEDQLYSERRISYEFT